MNGSLMKVVALAALAVLVPAAGADAGWWDDVADAEKVKLTDVIEKPRDYLHKEVTFTCMFHEVTKFYNPYYTRFIPSQYINFAVWPAEKRIWKRGEYMESHSFLFMEKDHKSIDEIRGLEKYARIKLTGYVQNSFKNTPWIEVRHVEVLEDSFSQDTLRRIIRGDQAAETGDWDTANRHYLAATRARLPVEVAASVEMKRSKALENLGRAEEARASLRRALEFMPGDQELQDALAALGAPVETRAPETPAAEPTHVAPPPAAAPPPPVEASAPGPAPMRPAHARPVDPSRYRKPPAPMPPPAPGVEPGVLPVPKDTPTEQKIDEPTVEEPSDEVPAPKEPLRKRAPRKRMAGPM